MTRSTRYYLYSITLCIPSCFTLSCSNSSDDHTGEPVTIEGEAITIERPDYDNRPYRQHPDYQTKKPQPSTTRQAQTTKAPKSLHANLQSYVNSPNIFSTPDELNIPTKNQVTEGASSFSPPTADPNAPSATIKPTGN